MISGVKNARFWDRECWPARNCNDHRHNSNEQCSPLSCCWLGPCSLVSWAPGITIPWTSINNWFTHVKNSSAGALHVLVHFFDFLPTTTTWNFLNILQGDIKTEFFFPSSSWARFLRINKLLANWAGLKSFKNREMKHCVYDKRQTWICTWWPSFPFTYRLLFIITTG